MSSAHAEAGLLSEANKVLAGRVSELESMLQGGRSRREVELEGHLQQVGPCDRVCPLFHGLSGELLRHAVVCHHSTLLPA